MIKLGFIFTFLFASANAAIAAFYSIKSLNLIPEYLVALKKRN